MYLVKNKKNNVFYKSKISDGFNHYVFNDSEAHQFKNKWEANKQLKKFKHPENFEIVKYNGQNK